MLTRAVLRPGQKGAHRLVQKYGGRLVCVRYRCDYPDETRHETVEHNRHPALGDARPDPGGAQYPAGLGAIGYEKKDLQGQIKDVGARGRGPRRSGTPTSTTLVRSNWATGS